MLAVISTQREKGRPTPLFRTFTQQNHLNRKSYATGKKIAYWLAKLRRSP